MNLAVGANLHGSTVTSIRTAAEKNSLWKIVIPYTRREVQYAHLS